MYVHMSIHYPREGKEGELVESMHRFGEAMKHQPGLRQAHTLKDDSSNRLIGLAIWDSKEQWEAARPAMKAAVEGDDFEAWETRPAQVFHLHERLRDGP